MSDPKRDKALRTIASLKRVIDHPSTGEGERSAAQNRLDALKAKWDIKDTPPRANTSGKRDAPKGAYGFEQDIWNFVHENFRGKEKTTDETAHRIRREQERYEAWKKANDAMVKKMAAEKAREVKQRAEREAAQKRWEERNRARDARGVPLTDEEKREAMADPLGWAAKQDARTQAERNRDMQETYSHEYGRGEREKPGPNTCTPLSLFDSKGKKRKRNDYPTYCRECGTHLGVGQGAIWQESGKWVAQCAVT